MVLLIYSGDIHPIPGTNPLNISEMSTISNDSMLSMSNINVPNHFHYNVQSLFQKIGSLTTELSSFDIVSLSETWLSNSISSDEIRFPGFHKPIRKDRFGDDHGGVKVYVRDTANYIRRQDIKVINIECIWIELQLCNNRKVFFAFSNALQIQVLSTNRAWKIPLVLQLTLEFQISLLRATSI